MEDTTRFAGKNLIIKKYYKIFEVHTDLRLLVENTMDKKHAIDMRKPEEGAISFLLGKSYKTHGVILELCREGFGEDAGILTRALFETAVTVLYITREDVTKRATQYVEHEWVLRKLLYECNFDLIKRSGSISEETIQEVMTKAKEVIEKYKKEGLDVGGFSWSGLSTKKMANEIGLESAYNSVYAQFSDIAHSRVSAASSFVKEDTGGLLIDTGPSERLLETVLVASFHFMFLVITAWDKTLKLGLKSKLDALLKRYEKLVKQINY